MTTWDVDHESRRRRLRDVLNALFDEAWELQRRRLLWLVAVVTAFAVGLLALTPGTPGPSHSVPAAAVSHGVVTSEALPKADALSSMATLNGKLLVWSSGGAVESEPGAVLPAASCRVAQVDPATLALITARSGRCADPSLYGEHVLPVITAARGGETGSIGSIHISVASADRTNGYRIGPALVRYPICSDCDATWTYGAGALWIYAPTLTAGNGQTGVLLRVSERTGAVTQQWEMPSLTRALLATDSDGLWIAPSVYSGYPPHVTPAQKRDDQSLYRVTTGMRRPQRTFDMGGNGARWLVASGSSVWLTAGSPTDVTLIALSGPDARPRLIRRAAAGSSSCGELGDGDTLVSGSTQAGIYCLDNDDSSTVFRFDPATAAVTQVTKVALPHDDDAEPTAVHGSSFYFLAPPNFRYGPDNRYVATTPSVLYRVSAH